MKLIMPVAGHGTRMRPHTWSRPKPLLPLAGKAMLGHVLDLFRDLPIDEYVLIVGRQGEQIEAYVRANYTIPAHFVEQVEMLGQAHAYWLAREHFTGPCMTFFPDTLFDATDFSCLSQPGLDGVVFTKPIDDPRPFGVVVTDSDGRVTKLIEKPDSLENKNVMIGMYYFRDGAWFVQACEELIRRRIQTRGEFFQADAVSLMVQQGAVFATNEVGVWLDAGMPRTVLATHRYLLDHGADNSTAALRPGVVIIPPVYIHSAATVERSVIGPYVSIGKGSRVSDSLLRDTIVDEGSDIWAMMIEQSLIGRWVRGSGSFQHLNIGDSSQVSLTGSDK